MQRIIKNHGITGGILSAVVVSGLLLLVAVCMLVDYFGGGETGAEATIIVASAVGIFAVVIGIFAALAQRLREVKRGEEDEARKY